MKAHGLPSRGNEKVLITRLLSGVGYTHVYQFVRATLVMVNSPLEPFKDESYTPLKVQSTEIDAMYAICYQSCNHIDCELDAVVFHKLVVMLYEDGVTIAPELQESRTLISLRSARTEDGTEVPQSFVIRRKDA
jgi:hypothetical protein